MNGKDALPSLCLKKLDGKIAVVTGASEETLHIGGGIH